jgi:hypothetical protein
VGQAVPNTKQPVVGWRLCAWFETNVQSPRNRITDKNPGRRLPGS